ncbi:MAG TPA: hypothetical protein V6C85_30150 [Allocoleopsis sp.]
MKILTAADLLADVEFVDYWDAKSLANPSSLNLLSDIQFIDYWDSEVWLNDADSTISLDDLNTDIFLEA